MDEIIALENRRFEAMTNQDAQALDEILADLTVSADPEGYGISPRSLRHYRTRGEVGSIRAMLLLMQASRLVSGPHLHPRHFDVRGILDGRSAH